MHTEQQPSFVERLTPIWERQLGKSSIGPEDDFFTLGGNAVVAKRIFQDVATVTTEPPPAVTIFVAPTIASMAALIERPYSVSFPTAVRLRNDGDLPPIFLAHGIGNNVLDLLQLAGQLKTDRPIYGLQAIGIYGIEAPHERVEDMARFYLDKMKKIQPTGPYTLIGYSLGGLVMLEIAQRLHARDEEVDLLVMLDAYPSKQFLRPVPFFESAARRAKKRVFQRFQKAQPLPGSAISPEVQHQIRMNYLALARYKPRFYLGEVRFIRAAEASYFPSNPVRVWGHLVAKLDVETVPGDHAGMLALHSDKIATLISRYLSDGDSSDGDRNGATDGLLSGSRAPILRP